MRSIFRKSITAIAVTTSLGLALPAAASDVVGSIENISDVSSYTVRVTNPATGLERTLSVSEGGTFRFASLPSGNYEIQVIKNGNVVAEDTVRVSLGANSRANFDLSQASSDGVERIQVVGARVSSIDLSTADSGLVITDAEIDRMP
ncbi:MAG: carboxypeptidase-like regulatory domain-containing protein [Pseudoalteromonas prydzensis]|uniref:carboxypeptidase-like regulatory domain-containing protein n=1 Tax=Pseudoalteromonas prydzensis TaxID=182141 RepID=UPI003F9CEC50